MKIVLSIAIFLVFIISGCGSKEGVVSSAQKSYLYFTGDTNGVEVSVDKGTLFSVKSGQENQYGVKPGKHMVEAYRKGKVILRRDIYLGDGIAKEIEVN